MRIFPLFLFSDGNIIVGTRALTQEQAMSYAEHSKCFRHGVTIFPLDYCPIEAAELYGESHASGWLHRPPRWLQQLEYRDAIEKGTEGVIADIAAKLSSPNYTEPILMYEGRR